MIAATWLALAVAVSPDTTRRYSLDGPGRVLCAQGDDTLWVTTLTRTEQLGDVPPCTLALELVSVAPDPASGHPLAKDREGWIHELDPVTGRRLGMRNPAGPGLALLAFLLAGGTALILLLRRR